MSVYAWVGAHACALSSVYVRAFIHVRVRVHACVRVCMIMAKAHEIGTSSIKKCLLLGTSTRFS